ncbi:MAG: electron transfer flavoprotein subunit alpha/FixB family protein [Chloroflexota bacterium]
MANDIFVIVEHLDGVFSDVSFEMVGKAKELAGELGGKVIAVALGSGLAANGFASDTTLLVDDLALAHFNPEAHGRVLEALVREKSPRLVMFGWTAFGMDLAAWLSTKTGYACVAYVRGVSQQAGELVITSQAYNGRLVADLSPEGGKAILAVLAGAFPFEAGEGATQAEVISSPVALDGLRIKFLESVKPAVGDVDITAQTKLVSVGRGIGGKANVELAEDLAKALGAVVSASRPVIDARWLPTSRQVGKSGRKVKPKLYLALGISGAPEHLEGMKSAELIVAINIDKKAPIFNYAHYGATVDLFEVVEAMLELL